VRRVFVSLAMLLESKQIIMFHVKRKKSKKLCNNNHVLLSGSELVRVAGQRHFMGRRSEERGSCVWRLHHQSLFLLALSVSGSCVRQTVALCVCFWFLPCCFVSRYERWVPVHGVCQNLGSKSVFCAASLAMPFVVLVVLALIALV
jgi:hypothetical protein